MFPNEIGPRLIQDNFDFWKKFDNQKMNEYHDGIDFMMLLLPESEIPSVCHLFFDLEDSFCVALGGVTPDTKFW